MQILARSSRFLFALAESIGAIIFGGGLLLGPKEIARVEAASALAGVISNLNSVQNNMVDNTKSVVSKLSDLGKTVDTHEKLIKLIAGGTEMSIISGKRLKFVTHLLSDKNNWALGDPATEDISRIIDNIIHKEYRGYEQSTTEELRVILSGSTSIITNLVGPGQNKHMCKNTILLKTVITPGVDLTTRTQYKKSTNGLWKDINTGIKRIFSIDGIFTQFMTLRQEKIRIVGRSCEILGNITVESEKMDTFLNEAMTIFTNTPFTETEKCKN